MTGDGTIGKPTLIFKPCVMYSRKSETMCEAGPGHGRPGQAMGGRAGPWEASEAAANNASARLVFFKGFFVQFKTN